MIDEKIIKEKIENLNSEIEPLSNQLQQAQILVQRVPLQIASRQGGIIELKKLLEILHKKEVKKDEKKETKVEQ